MSIDLISSFEASVIGCCDKNSLFDFVASFATKMDQTRSQLLTLHTTYFVSSI